ncbi:TetR/AcrR family transcriptional regulator [Chelativorans sp.]|uniref:TetR/AcrR family transcriptional regulator n=1 Tax=Chelativorans sp. TaxID=2203393 RepID=UPI0028110B90|nr:TetR/AcrR family transcriptional regulator [Chelativorans sp.]
MDFSVPRPKLHSDDQILQAAQTVLLNKGPAEFTLSDVANAVGISRAALIQRFKDKANLHHRVMEQMTQEVRDYFATAPTERGLAPLWEMLKDLIAGMGPGRGSEVHLLLLWGDCTNPQLRALAGERNELVRAAIEFRLPAEPHDPRPTSALIQAVIQGAFMQWMVAREGELAAFMAVRTRQILTTLYPGHPFAD